MDGILLLVSYWYLNVQDCSYKSTFYTLLVCMLILAYKSSIFDQNIYEFHEKTVLLLVTHLMLFVKKIDTRLRNMYILYFVKYVPVL